MAKIDEVIERIKQIAGVQGCLILNKEGKTLKAATGAAEKTGKLSFFSAQACEKIGSDLNIDGQNASVFLEGMDENFYVRSIKNMYLSIELSKETSFNAFEENLKKIIKFQ